MSERITWIEDGDIFRSTCRVLVNPVNCVGTSGAGLAKHFRVRYPNAQEWYEDRCRDRPLDPGHIYLYRDGHATHDVLFFTTKDHWRSPSRVEWIEQGLGLLVYNQRWLRIESMAFPKLGCGLGSLSWVDVKPVMEPYLEELVIEGIRVEVYV